MVVSSCVGAGVVDSNDPAPGWLESSAGRPILRVHLRGGSRRSPRDGIRLQAYVPKAIPHDRVLPTVQVWSRARAGGGHGRAPG
ncbi:hypothetical protein GCM10022399_35870 [Terrabacter ginsenosidimutans]|uniref:Uncharacterized protein n=1 Tax=Terrabacter ginsenosidimutans TaxID=490575 RepID=A0ABP7EB66_9MICO